MGVEGGVGAVWEAHCLGEGREGVVVVWWVWGVIWGGASHCWCSIRRGERSMCVMLSSCLYLISCKLLQVLLYASAVFSDGPTSFLHPLGARGIYIMVIIYNGKRIFLTADGR